MIRLIFALIYLKKIVVFVVWLILLRELQIQKSDKGIPVLYPLDAKSITWDACDCWVSEYISSKSFESEDVLYLVYQFSWTRFNCTLDGHGKWQARSPCCFYEVDVFAFFVGEMHLRTQS